jgi:3-deoxy-D-manno-octulosonic-acid transferase
MYFIYTFVLTLGLVLTLPYYLVRFRKYLPTLRDRFGLLKVPQLRHAIWVHAVSVGEVKAVEKLLERIRQQFPGKPLVVSTATPAGQQLARERHDIVDHTFYFPIDLPSCVRRSLDRIDPEMVIIAETEIWPNFLRACRERGARVVMINGRISDKSFARYRLGRRWLRRVFEDYTILGMQSEMDRQRIEAIGADPRKVTVFGNLKYDAVASNRSVDDTLSTFLKEWKPLWIAASTMAGEEELVLDAFQKILERHPGLRLLIAPRHADRFDLVAEMIRNRGFQVLRRTQLQAGNSPPKLGGELQNPRIFLLDTIGELATVFQYAAVVYMGGSLVPTGGHNVLEPARHSKPIVFGPHMENFREIARLFLDAKGAIQIQNAAGLAPAISEALSNPQHASELGRNALAIVDQNTGATERVLQVLEPVEARR